MTLSIILRSSVGSAFTYQLFLLSLGQEGSLVKDVLALLARWPAPPSFPVTKCQSLAGGRVKDSLEPTRPVPLVMAKVLGQVEHGAGTQRVSEVFCR